VKTNEVFALYHKDPKKVVAYTQNAVTIGEWVLADTQNSVHRLTIPEYWAAFAKDQTFDGRANFFTVLEDMQQSALDNEDELVLTRLTQLNEFDLEAYHEFFNDMTTEFYKYLREAQRQSEADAEIIAARETH
jgi:ATP-dependent protease HslVU (ClpYQ) peptidase subunit